MGKFKPSSDQTAPEGIQRFIRDNDIRWVDVQFTDVPGIEQHLTVPVSEFDEGSAYELIGVPMAESADQRMVLGCCVVSIALD